MITKITEIKGLNILNKHTNIMYKNQIIWIIKTDKKVYALDMLANKDITDVDYLETIETKKTKYKILFEDELFN